MNMAKIYLENFFINLKYLPSEFYIPRLAKMAKREVKEKYQSSNLKTKVDETKEKTAHKKADDREMKKAQKAYKENNDEGSKCSDRVYNNIILNSPDDELKRANLVKRAAKAQSMITYILYYITDPEAQLIKMNQTEREFANGVAAIYEFGKIYENSAIADLRIYDPESEEYYEYSKYFICIDELMKRREDECFMKKVQERKEQLMLESLHPEDDEPEVEEVEANPAEELAKVEEEIDLSAVVKPVFVQENPFVLVDPSLPKQGTGVSDALFEKLEKVFNPLFENTSYRYEMKANGLINLFVTKSNLGVEDTYVVDPGIVMGRGEVCILAKTAPEFNDTIFVSVKRFPEIVKRILSSVFYVLEKDELQQVIDGYFRNMNIYRYVDMSNTDKMKDLTDAEFQKLGKKLTYILSKVKEQSTGMDLPRFRFNHFESIDDFMIISDPAVKSPLADINETSSIICEGLIFEVKCDDVIQTYKSSRIEFYISEYGDM